MLVGTSNDRKLKHNATERYRTFLIAEKVAEIGAHMQSVGRDFKLERLHILGNAVDMIEELKAELLEDGGKTTSNGQHKVSSQPRWQSTALNTFDLFLNFPTPQVIFDSAGGVLECNKWFSSVFRFRRDGQHTKQSKLSRTNERHVVELYAPRLGGNASKQIPKADVQRKVILWDSLVHRLQGARAPSFVTLQDVVITETRDCLLVFEGRISRVTSTKGMEAFKAAFVHVCLVRSSISVDGNGGLSVLDKSQLPTWSAGSKFPIVVAGPRGLDVFQRLFFTEKAPAIRTTVRHVAASAS